MKDTTERSGQSEAVECELAKELAQSGIVVNAVQ